MDLVQSRLIAYIETQENTVELLKPAGLTESRTMQVTVKLFAIYQDVYGTPERTLALPTGSPVCAVLDQMLTEHPELEPWRSLTRFAVNLVFVEPETKLQDGDEVVLIPPVSGG